MRSTLRVIIPSASAALVILGCKAKINTRSFEDQVRQQTSALGLQATRVTCPADVDARPGAVFICQVELDGKKAYALDVTLKQVDAKAGKGTLDTAWHDGAAVVTGKLEAGLSEELGKTLGGAVTVECGDEPLRFLDPQRRLQCELAAGDVSSVLTVDFDAALVPTDWHLKPALLGRAKLEDLLTPSVRAQTTPGVKVDCGPAMLLVRPADGIVWCSIADADKRAQIKVEIDDKLTVQRWEVATPPG